MPRKLRFRVSGPRPHHPFYHINGLRALPLRWIDAVDTPLAAHLHDLNRPKPYTVSPLWWEPEEAAGGWFELSLLDDTLEEPLRAGQAVLGDALTLGRWHYHVTAVETAAPVTWTDLWESPARSEWSFRLLTPTAHHALGVHRRSVVLPAPDLYFGSWATRWGLYGDPPLPPDLLRLVEEQGAVAECAGQTERVQLDPGRVCVGFVGQVRFLLVQPRLVTRDEATALTALARFAAYCGTGVDTMRGLGQTVYLLD